MVVDEHLDASLKTGRHGSRKRHPEKGLAGCVGLEVAVCYLAKLKPIVGDLDTLHIHLDADMALADSLVGLLDQLNSKLLASNSELGEDDILNTEVIEGVRAELEGDAGLSRSNKSGSNCHEKRKAPHLFLSLN